MLGRQSRHRGRRPGSKRSEGPYDGRVRGKRTQLVQPPAVRMNVGRIAAAGTVVFFLVFVALLPFWGWLQAHGHEMWLWTCLAGWLLGIAGWLLAAKHRREGRTR